jgi:hypothetical protein
VSRHREFDRGVPTDDVTTERMARDLVGEFGPWVLSYPTVRRHYRPSLFERAVGALVVVFVVFRAVKP